MSLSTPLDVPTPRAFLPFLAPARYKGAHGGRGSGKSHHFAEKAALSCLKPGTRGVCIREVQKTLQESAKRLIEDKIATLGVGSHFDCQKDRIVTPGNGVILFQGMQDHTAESIKSLEGFDWAWVEEAQTLSARSLEMLRPTIRKPGSELWFTWNPRNAADPVDALLRGPEPPPNAVVREVNYYDNPFFPPELEEERLYDQRTKPERYAHIWRGAYEPTAIGAIWDRVTLHRTRRAEPPQLTRILIAVDPAVSDEPGSDEHGIVVVGLGADGRGYVLADMSCRGGPEEWARTAVAAYDLYSADGVVIEKNQGGDMCRYTLQTVRKNLPIIEVHASRGKHVRAEPIAALYKLDKVSHVGTFGELEQQMCQMTAAGYQGSGSPDRCDALVWGLTQLFPAVTAVPKEGVKLKQPMSLRLGAGGAYTGGWMR